MKAVRIHYWFGALVLAVLLQAGSAFAQPDISAKVDAKQITIGDQVRLFLEAKPAKGERLIWPVIPDTFNSLEVVEKGKIDTITKDNAVTYKQRLLITGWDSGVYKIPPFAFTSVPVKGEPYQVTTDSFRLAIRTVAVDTAKPFRPIAEIMEVKTTWRDYIWYILGGLLALGLIVFAILYFVKNKKAQAPVAAPKRQIETPVEKALRMLNELEQKQLWQNDHVKQYYTELTDILRNYIEERFNTPAMELTSDELLAVVRKHKQMMKHIEGLMMILRTADMAKFAKAQPLPHEHTEAFDHAMNFVKATKPVEQTQEGS